MKKQRLVAGTVLAVALVAFSSCEKSEDLNVNDIEGVYAGNFSVSRTLEGEALEGSIEDQGSAVVSLMANNQIEVHCFGEAIDTTFMLDYYEHNDSIMVCLTGDAFEHMYGHSLGGGHMGGGMMNDIQKGETQWGHHMHDEHADGDEHFGGFDLHERTFSYAFKMMDETSPHYLRFHGTKQ